MASEMIEPGKCDRLEVSEGYNRVAPRKLGGRGLHYEMKGQT